MQETLKKLMGLTGPIAQLVEPLLSELDFVGWNPGRTIPKV